MVSDLGGGASTSWTWWRLVQSRNSKGPVPSRRAGEWPPCSRGGMRMSEATTCVVAVARAQGGDELGADLAERAGDEDVFHRAGSYSEQAAPGPWRRVDSAWRG